MIDPVVATCILPGAVARYFREMEYISCYMATLGYAAADSNVGATLLVMRNGTALLQDNVGMGDRERLQPVTNATIYH